jgi:hypothetical protein
VTAKAKNGTHVESWGRWADVVRGLIGMFVVGPTMSWSSLAGQARARGGVRTISWTAARDSLSNHKSKQSVNRPEAEQISKRKTATVFTAPLPSRQRGQGLHSCAAGRYPKVASPEQSLLTLQRLSSRHRNLIAINHQCETVQFLSTKEFAAKLPKSLNLLKG